MAENIFRQAVYVLYGNPILFLLPSIGFIISITIEVTFAIGLYNNNNPNYFPSANSLIIGIFFVGFIITYLQLAITRNIILKKRLQVINSRNRVEIFLIFIIYSFYALVIVQIGGYEAAVRKDYVADSDRFSLYAEKLKGFHDVIAVIPAGIGVIMFSTIFSIIFNSWMILVLSRYQDMNIHVFHQSIKDFISIVTADRYKVKYLIWLFVLTSIITAIEFTLTNIAILPEASTLNLYIFQFIISGVIESVYFTFLLTCLFLVLLPRIRSQ